MENGKCEVAESGGETGRGFYPIEDEVEIVLESLLMFGIDEVGKDIPAYWINALRENEILEERTHEIPVGVRYIEPDNEKVYSK